MSGDAPIRCLAGGAGSGDGGSEDRPFGALDAALALVSASPGLKSRNVRVAGRRTSIRLVPSMWTALQEIAAAEGMSLVELVSAIDAQRDPRIRLANSVRTFAQEYYRRRWRETLTDGNVAGPDQGADEQRAAGNEGDADGEPGSG